MNLNDPIWFGLLAISLVALSVFFLDGWKRYTTIAVVAFSPILLFLGWIVISLPEIGFPIDFKKNAWVAMGMIMVIVYNCLWMAPVLAGVIVGYAGRWIQKQRVKQAE